MCIITWVARDKKTDCFFSGRDLNDVWLVEHLWEVQGCSKEEIDEFCERFNYIDWIVYPVINLNV